MNTELQTFEFQSHQLTLVTDERGEPWFIAKEVCEILEYADTSMTIKRLDEDEKLIQTIFVSGQNREVLLINESGLYSLILTSRKPEAKAFKKWVTSEVLPTIRKTGSYSTQGFSLLQAKYIALLEEKVEWLKADRVSPKRRSFAKDEINAAIRSRLEGYSTRDIGILLGRAQGSISGLFSRLAQMEGAK